MMPVKKILIATPDESLIRLIQSILESNNYESEYATTTIDTFRILENSADCILILDYNLPETTVQDFIVDIRRKNIYCPFIVMLAPEVGQYASQMLDIGAHDFIMKGDSLKDTIKPIIYNVNKQLLTEFQLSEISQKLIKSEEKIQNIIETVNDVYYEADLNGIIIELSPSIQFISKYKREEIIGKSLADFYPDPDIRAIFLEKLNQNGYLTDYEIELFDKDGTLNRCVISAKIINSEQSALPFKIIGSFSNIEKRKQAEESRIEMKTKYSKLILNLNDIIFTTDLNGRFTSVNPAVQKILGYSVAEFLQLDYEEILTPHSLVLTLENLRKKAEDKEDQSDYEAEVMHKDGKIMTFEINSFISTTNGLPNEISGIAHDITERKKLINELNRNYDVQRVINSLLHLSLEDIPIKKLLNKAIELIVNLPWLSFEKKGAIFLANSDDNLEMSAYYGLSAEVVTACKNVPAGKCVCGKVLVSKKAVFENEINHNHDVNYHGMKDHGHYCVPILFADKVFGVINTYLKAGHSFSDFEIGFLNSVANTLSGIIARKKAEAAAQEMLDKLESTVNLRTQELSDTENLYLTTVNSFNDWVFVIDREYCIVFFNQSLQNIFTTNGFAGNFTGSKLKEVLSFLNSETYYAIGAVFKTGKEIIEEAEFYAFGKNYITQLIISPILQDGKVVRLVVTVHDFTEIKKVEEEFRKNLNKEKELNLLKSQFISTVSHEFRTPLAGILSSVQLLKRYGEKWDIEKKEKIYKQVFDAVSHTKSLLDDVSLINKEQSNKLHFKPDYIELRPLINQIIEENLSLYGSDYIVKTTFDLNSEKYYLDPVMLRHIFSNLISNALKYSKAKKEILVDFSELNSQLIKLVVTDQGIGIPADDLKYVFEPFHRASNVEDIQGTGFGMSIVKRFVELHQGEIRAESEVNKGTKVTVILPCNINT